VARIVAKLEAQGLSVATVDLLFLRKFRLLSQVIPHVIVVTTDLLDAVNKPAPRPRQKHDEKWTQAELCRSMDSGRRLPVDVADGALRLRYLHVAWGGVYIDADERTAVVRECFSLADQIVAAAESHLEAGDGLTIVASTWYGGYWSASGETLERNGWRDVGEVQVLTEALDWLREASSAERAQ